MKDDCSARHNGKPFAEWRKEWELEERYNFRTIESKWQKIWDEEKAYKVEIDRNREKFYVLVEFPYPSGAGLHVAARGKRRWRPMRISVRPIRWRR